MAIKGFSSNVETLFLCPISSKDEKSIHRDSYTISRGMNIVVYKDHNEKKVYLIDEGKKIVLDMS